MPGASLWFIPYSSSSFTQTTQALISQTIPPHFPQTKTHDFIPHVTITSQIDQSLYGKDPQAWLGSLQLPFAKDDDPVIISLESLESQDAFVKKLFLKAGKSESVVRLVVACRAAAVEKGDVGKAEKWAQDEYMPHLSLMYADLPSSEVKKHLDIIQEDCQKAARRLEADDNGTVSKGGSIVLVDTSKPIDQWSPIAEREVSHLNWIWPWSKSRFDD